MEYFLAFVLVLETEFLCLIFFTLKLSIINDDSIFTCLSRTDKRELSPLHQRLWVRPSAGRTRRG